LPQCSAQIHDQVMYLESPKTITEIYKAVGIIKEKQHSNAQPKAAKPPEPTTEAAAYCETAGIAEKQTEPETVIDLEASVPDFVVQSNETVDTPHFTTSISEMVANETVRDKPKSGDGNRFDRLDKLVIQLMDEVTRLGEADAKGIAAVLGPIRQYLVCHGGEL
jgi:hypothetical protein